MSDSTSQQTCWFREGAGEAEWQLSPTLVIEGKAIDGLWTGTLWIASAPLPDRMASTRRMPSCLSNHMRSYIPHLVILWDMRIELATPHEKALMLLFAEVESTAAEQRAALLGTPGAITERTNENGTRFWVHGYEGSGSAP